MIIPTLDSLECKKNGQAFGIKASELAAAGKTKIPEELISNKHLIYSSPATLAFNSPGAQGYGVKRAGLSIPGSVMLIVSPGCCGRNTTILTEFAGYTDRFFFQLMDETDIVTGRHLRKIPQAVEEIYESLEEKPSVVMICITCVDALLGTDMERVCKKASDRVGIPVLPCYMYALTREGRKPPMVHVRQSIYSLLERNKVRGNMVNLMGYFAPLEEDSELLQLLQSIGVKKINQIGDCQTYEEYLEMGNANFNLVLNPEARYAAGELNKKLGMPFIELTRLYQIDKIKKQYELFAAALGTNFQDQTYYEQAMEAVERLRKQHPDLVFSIGEGCNANPYELALALLKYGFTVHEVFGNITEEDFVYVNQIAELSPETIFRSNLDPSMIYFKADPAVNLAIGRDALYYYPEVAGLEWCDDVQPFGYSGLKHLMQKIVQVLKKREEE